MDCRVNMLSWPADPTPGSAQEVGCSKGDAGRLLRKLLVMGVLQEDTFRQENEYGTVASRMLVNRDQAAGILYVS